MCEALDIIENRGMKKGFEQGIREGRLELLIELVKEGKMSAEVAASKENMSVEEFEAIAKSS